MHNFFEFFSWLEKNSFLIHSELFPFSVFRCIEKMDNKEMFFSYQYLGSSGSLEVDEFRLKMAH